MPRGPTVFVAYRAFLFGLLVVSNAVICSAGVWSLTQAQTAHLATHVQAYMIFLGAFSLLLVLPVIFIDIFTKHAISGRVWVECAWMTLLAIFHIAGAAAVTATLPRDLCTAQGTLSDHRSQRDELTLHHLQSKLLLEGFAWICTTNLLVYLCLLLISTALHARDDDTVWHASVKSYPWYIHFPCRQLKSRPGSPTSLPFSPSRIVTSPLPAPRPQHPMADFSRYQIEPLSLSADAQSLEKPVPPMPAPPAQHVMQQTRGATAPRLGLYPLHIQSALVAPAGAPAGAGPSPSALSVSPSSPSRLWRLSPADEHTRPLGDWPRRDIMQQPSPSKSRGPASASASAAATTPASRAGPPPLSASARIAAAGSADDLLTRRAGSPSEAAAATVPSSWASRGSLDRSRPTGPRHRTRTSSDTSASYRPAAQDSSGVSISRPR
ncbi:hypothetical protein FA95DRAFT_1603186 [Auriscalpium vulgare]|uniref:Uncharacterized protein n=1 Tax=Auriscalpium vulgare TaxID=40419 RepID=A0ACB8S350_9AGAM|nr:hypothetical protein FA95DRAFT_1603186 [Auriscalpium vulgare]